MAEREPIKENEIVCGFCGPGTNAIWEVVLTDYEHLFLCNRDRNALLDAELVLAEGRIGDMRLEDHRELVDFLNKRDRLTTSTEYDEGNPK